MRLKKYIERLPHVRAHTYSRRFDSKTKHKVWNGLDNKITFQEPVMSTETSCPRVQHTNQHEHLGLPTPHYTYCIEACQVFPYYFSNFDAKAGTRLPQAIQQCVHSEIRKGTR